MSESTCGGALHQTLTISISNGGEYPERGFTADILLGPDGTSFSQSVQLTIPLERASNGLGIHRVRINLAVRPEAQTMVSTQTSIDLESRSASAKISHFSRYRLMSGRFATNKTITFAFRSLPSNLAPGYVEETLKSAIRRAFETWAVLAERAGIRFQETQSSKADIEFFEGTGTTTNCGPSFGDPRNILFQGRCHLNWLAGLNGDKVRIEFEESDRFRWAAPTGASPSSHFDIQAAAIHEIGHALGLNHPNETCKQPPVMCTNPQIESNMYVPRRILAIEDVRAFEAIYQLDGNQQSQSGRITPTVGAPAPVPTPTSAAKATARIWSEKESYPVGASGAVCYEVSQPGHVVITDTEPNGKDLQFYSGPSAGLGECKFVPRYDPPVGTDTLRIDLYDGQSLIASGQSTYRITEASPGATPRDSQPQATPSSSSLLPPKNVDVNEAFLLYWTAPSVPVSGYRIYLERCPYQAPCLTTLRATVAPTALSYSFKGFVCDCTARFGVAAFEGNRESPIVWVKP